MANTAAFEGNDFSEFTGTTGAPATTSAAVHHGTYCMIVDDEETAYWDISSTNDATYIRCEFRAIALPTNDYYRLGVCGFAPFGYHGFPVYSAVYCDPADSTAKFTLFDDYTSAESISDFEPSAGVWYCVVSTYDRNGTTYMYIDGVEEASLSCPNVATDYAFVGTPASPDGSAYIDCVVQDSSNPLCDTYMCSVGGVPVPAIYHNYRRINKIIRG